MYSEYNIYILKTTNGIDTYYKIGYSSNISERLRGYRSHNPFIEIVDCYYREQGFKYENVIHSMFKSSYMTEWYDEATYLEIVNFIDSNITIELPTKLDTKNMDIFERMEAGLRVNFKKLCKEYKTANSIRKIQIAKYYPLIKEAYDKLGASKVGSCEYSEHLIKKALIANDTLKSDKSKIVELLKLENGKFYSRVELKDKLSSAYEALEIEVSAKATDITKYYDVKEKVAQIDGVRIKGFVIINQL